MLTNNFTFFLLLHSIISPHFFLSSFITQRKGPTASLAVAPKTPRYLSDIDPVGERERERRKKEKQRIYKSHAKAAAQVEANNNAIDETEGMSRQQRAQYALKIGGRNPRDNFAPELDDDKDYLSNPSGHKDHDAMAERGRKRREQKGMLRQDEEKAMAEANRRKASREKAKKRRWLREREAAARKNKSDMLDEENTAKGINLYNGGKKSNSTQNLHGDEDGDDGDLSSDTDSDDEKRHTVNKAQVNAFHERQKEAERKKQEKVLKIENELKLKNARKWQTTTPYIENGETGQLTLPPSAPMGSSSPTEPQYPVGTGSRAALALSKARAALGEASPRQQMKPSVVSLGL